MKVYAQMIHNLLAIMVALLVATPARAACVSQAQERIVKQDSHEKLVLTVAGTSAPALLSVSGQVWFFKHRRGAIGAVFVLRADGVEVARSDIQFGFLPRLTVNLMPLAAVRSVPLAAEYSLSWYMTGSPGDAVHLTQAQACPIGDGNVLSVLAQPAP